MDSDDEKQLLSARREVASLEKGESAEQKDWIKQSRDGPTAKPSRFEIWLEVDVSQKQKHFLKSYSGRIVKPFEG